VFRDAIEAPDGPELAELAEVTGLAELALVEPKRFRSRFERVMRTPLDPAVSSEVWPVLSAEAFVRQLGGAR
jgi:hypothetical protein